MLKHMSCNRNDTTIKKCIIKVKVNNKEYAVSYKRYIIEYAKNNDYKELLDENMIDSCISKLIREKLKMNKEELKHCKLRLSILQQNRIRKN